MIDLTVKTLDSLNHAFSLEDDQITVRGFKEHIAESVSIPASSQRLIYCGRVLQDDKKLNDYDVNGKVIHLVQRSPPQPGQRRNDNGQGQDQNHGVQLWQNPQRTQYRITGTQMHGNAMYLGATSVPAEIVEGHVHQLSSSTRLRLVTRLLDNANLLMGRLAASIARNPNCPNNLLSTSETSQPPSAQQGQEPQTDLLNDNGAINSARLREATNAVIAAATSAAGLSNTPLYRENSDNNVETVPMNETDDENQPQSHTQQSQPSQSEQQGSASNSDPSGERTLPQMAALLELLMNAQDCLRPYIEHYRTLMLEDPVLPTGGGHGSVEESQEIVNCVSKNLHSLSHACHALSDIIVDMSQEPPRSLRCRPSINPQATILQSGVPIQVEAHFSIQGQNSNNNNTNEESGQGTNMTAQSEGNETGSESNNQQSDSGVHQEQIHPPFVFNLPNDMVVMAVNPEGNIDFGTGNEHAQPGENNNNNNNDNNNGGRIGGATDAFSWSSMSTDFLRNAVEVVAGHIIHGGIAASALNTQNLPTGGQQTMSSLDGNTNAGQSTQARSNVGTHPTTSTQTRSTSRQQAYPLNVGMSIGQMYEFDPFFPCSSHHIRSTPSTFNTIPSMSQRPRTNQPSTTESPPQAQTATTSATTAATTSATTTSNTNSTNTTSNTNTSSAPSSSSSSSSQNSLTNLLKQALRVAMAGQPQPATLSNNGNNADGITQDELELARQFSFISTCPNLLAVLQGVRGLRTGDILLYTILGPRQPRNERNLFLDLTSLMLQNLTIDDYIHLRCGSSRPFANLRELVLEFLVNTFPYSTAEEIQEQTANQLLTQIRPRLESVFADEVINSRNGSQIDIVGTIESLLQRHIKRIVLILFNTTDIDGSVFGQETYNNLQTLKRQLHGVLRYSICGGKTRLRVIMIRLQTGRLQYSPRILGRWWREIFISSGPEEAQHQLTDEEIISLLVYQTPSSQPAATVPSEPLQQSPPAQVEAEPIETEVVEERITLEALAANDDEEIPETFPSHELLPSDWVPIIARDGVKQRRQLQTERVTNGGVTPFSDAYLGTLSTKRRKLIEQQKPRLLTSPMRNHGAISASVEHLVRESVTRAGVEVDRAAIGVAVDPDVRRAFGQAIRDCLGPRRFESPDFPDSTRFPNATKYFADQDRPPK